MASTMAVSHRAPVQPNAHAHQSAAGSVDVAIAETQLPLLVQFSLHVPVPAGAIVVPLSKPTSDCVGDFVGSPAAGKYHCVVIFN